MLQEDVLSIVVISGEMFNKNVCLFSRAGEDVEMESSHSMHSRPPDLLLYTYIANTALSTLMMFFSQALIQCDWQIFFFSPSTQKLQALPFASLLQCLWLEVVISTLFLFFKHLLPALYTLRDTL